MLLERIGVRSMRERPPDKLFWSKSNLIKFVLQIPLQMAVVSIGVI